MKTPCKAACKNEGGICSGCHRTINEIMGWGKLSDDDRKIIMDKLDGTSTTHTCPQCEKSAQCDISMGKETCWCFELEKRDTSSVPKAGLCMCRNCLTALPVE
ncbi:DUF1289 domain-containing protein [Vibrio gallaecicus]|uniref:DUF1289 domain-containing protein n=1 Tax=Vibrio gallaecicus TaxID=552386 RepID=A0ABV4N9F2_9VIBR